MRVCYTTGPNDSYVAARGNDGTGPGQFSNIYKGGCADIGGTNVELTNPNSIAISGTYELLPAVAPK